MTNGDINPPVNVISLNDAVPPTLLYILAIFCIASFVNDGVPELSKFSFFYH